MTNCFTLTWAVQLLSCATRVFGLFTNWVLKGFLLSWQASSIARVLPQEPPDQTGVTVNTFYVKHFFFQQPVFSPYGSVKRLSTKLRPSCCQYSLNEGSELFWDCGVWLTDRRGKAAAAWRWLAPGRAFLRWAWCLPTCSPAPCPSPSGGCSFWMTAALHPLRPAHSLWIVPWQRRNLKRKAGIMPRVSIFAFVKHTALRRRPSSMLASAPLFSH